MTNRHRNLSTCLALSLLVIMTMAMLGPQTTGQNSGPEKSRKLLGEAPAKTQLMTLLIREFAADANSMRRFHGQPLEESAFVRWRQFYRSWQKRVDAIDFDGLPQPDRIDWILLNNHLRHETVLLKRRSGRLEEVRALLPFSAEILNLHSSYREQKRLDPKKAASALTRIQESIDALLKEGAGSRSGGLDGILEEPERTVISKVHALRAEGAVRSLKNRLEEWRNFYDGFDPRFTWWTKEPLKECLKSLDAYLQHLNGLHSGGMPEGEAALIGDPIGKAALVEELAAEMVACSPEELIALAKEEFQWCREEMIRQSRALGLGLGDDWRTALEKVKEDYAAPGEQDDEAANSVQDAVAFIDSNDLVSVPALCRETWYLTMLSRKEQEFLPYAVYRGQSSGIAYPTADTPHRKKLMSMRGNNRHFTRIVMAHELIPGHHLQSYQSERFREHRSLFRTPFLVEGWALHWEMLLYSMNYGRTPEEKIGMLFWRTHRCARILVSLQFHLGTMSALEMVNFLVEEVGMEREGATSEVRRYISDRYSPLYQCAYMTGGLQMRALYREIVEKGTMTPKDFHDAVLRENAIPIELIRARLLELPLTREYRARWDFIAKPAP